VIYLQDGALVFHKSLENLKKDTGKDRLSGAIASVMSKIQTR
jgi:Cu-processing system ATP-binding protein